MRVTGPHGTIGTSTNVNYLWTSTLSRVNNASITIRLNDGNTTYYSTPRPFRCIWPASQSDVLHGVNCQGPPGTECFATKDGMLVDSYDRPKMDVAAAATECRASGGQLPDGREFTRVVQAGLVNGTNAWLWINHPIYWYNGAYGYALGRWSGTGTTGWNYSHYTPGYGARGYGHDYRNFRCIYTPYLR